MARVSVTVGARVHAGFCNLSLERERLYGGIGLGLERPVLEVSAEPADAFVVDHEGAEHAARRTTEHLDLEGGVRVEMGRTLPSHVGLGSGTRVALAVAEATALAHGACPNLRELAPVLGRGGRSGVGVATYLEGGFVVDAGHPATAFTETPPGTGEWSVPPVVSRLELPDSWRVVLVVPDGHPGRSGATEEASIRTVVGDADPTIATEVASTVVEKLLPAAAAGDLSTFGAAVTAIGRANGEWYADLQGGRYRPSAAAIVDSLTGEPAVAGVGQSSWGPTVYALTNEEGVESVVSCGEEALASAGLEGTVLPARVDTSGRSVHDPA